MNWETTDLDGVLKGAWHVLTRGCEQAAHPLYTPVVGTVLEDRARLRIVVLRQVDPHRQTLAFHTDLRSGKIRELRADPNVTWLFYDPDEKVQLRVGTVAELHAEDEEARRAWEDLGPKNRRAYLGKGVPGARMEKPGSPLSEALQQRMPTKEESTPGFEHFCVVRCHVKEIDWLYLNDTGHRRARFRYENERVDSTWLVP